MRKVIDGSVYDDETAKRLFSVSDHNIGYYEALHRTKSGKYFLCKLVGDEHEITPISRKRAIIWSFGTDATEREIRRAFGASGESGHKQVAVRLPLHTYHTLRAMAAERGVSMAVVITDLVDGVSAPPVAEEGVEETPIIPDNLTTLGADERRKVYLESLPEDELYAALARDRKDEEDRIKRTAKAFKDQRRRVRKMSDEEREASLADITDGE